MGQIYAKLGNIISQISAVQKNSTNKDDGYKFRSIYDIYNQLHPIIKKEGVFFIPKILDSTETIVNTNKGRAFRVKIKVEWSIACNDGSNVTSIMIGEGIDSSDKASNKALTASLKYLLIYMFLIPTVPYETDSDFTSPSITPFEEKPKSLLGLAESKGLSHEDLKIIGLRIGLIDGGELNTEDRKKLYEHIANKTKDQLLDPSK